jgi:hypothetical protein
MGDKTTVPIAKTPNKPKGVNNVFETRFGIEVEFTGITREEAAEAVAKVVKGTVRGSVNYEVLAQDGRIWRIVSDGSIETQRRNSNRIVFTNDSDYSCELVSPILLYQNDIGTVQTLIRKLRKEGALTNDSCGIHIHLDGAPHTPRSIHNFVNIIASKNDLLYKALCLKEDRARFCKKMDDHFVAKLKQVRPHSFEQIADIWYAGFGGSREIHFHNSRYCFLNLHSFFTGNHTVELRAFNSDLHAGKVRSYIVLSLALNHQALVQRNASSRKVQCENEKFAMRTYLNRLGLIGDEFKSCREHLCQHLDGNGAWRRGSREATKHRNTPNGGDTE